MLCKLQPSSFKKDAIFYCVLRYDYYKKTSKYSKSTKMLIEIVYDF